LASAIREATIGLPGWWRAYRNFAAAFVVVCERAHARTPLKAAVKELDHLLWQP
jgi:hypothetical protein